MVEDSITKKVYAGPPKIRQRGEFLSEVYYAPAGISRDATVSRIISRAKNGAQRRVLEGLLRARQLGGQQAIGLPHQYGQLQHG